MWGFRLFYVSTLQDVSSSINLHGVEKSVFRGGFFFYKVLKKNIFWMNAEKLKLSIAGVYECVSTLNNFSPLGPQKHWFLGCFGGTHVLRPTPTLIPPRQTTQRPTRGCSLMHRCPTLKKCSWFSNFWSSCSIWCDKNHLIVSL